MHGDGGKASEDGGCEGGEAQWWAPTEGGRLAPYGMHLIWRIAKTFQLSFSLFAHCTEVRTWPRSGAKTKAAEHRRPPNLSSSSSSNSFIGGRRAKDADALLVFAQLCMARLGVPASLLAFC
jgi:hypothetical protein